MKSTLAVLALVLSTVTVFADFTPGKWLALSTEGPFLVAATNFTVSDSGQISGKSIFPNGSVARINGMIDSDGEVQFTQKAPGKTRTFSGQADGSGDHFRLKVKKVTITADHLPASKAFAGVYKASDTAKNLVWALVEPQGRITLYILKGGRYLYAQGRLRAGNRFSINGFVSNVRAEGAIRNGRLEGAYKFRGQTFGFFGTRL